MKDSYDYKWGYFAPRFGFEFVINRGGYFDSRYSVSFCFIWGMFNIKLPFNTRLGEGCDLPKYGIAIHNGTFWIYIGGDYDESMGQVTGNSWVTWYIPFVTWNHCKHETRDEKGNWSLVPNFTDRESIYRESWPYKYTLKSGKVQERIATIYCERRTWRRKWAPFLKMVKQSINIDFDKEVGEKSGSWKGGVLGCGWDMLKGETMKDTLYRMETERKF